MVQADIAMTERILDNLISNAVSHSPADSQVTLAVQAADGGARVTVADAGPGINEDDLARFRRQHVGIVFQSFHLVPTMSALENVALPLEFSGADNPAEQAEAALRKTGLGDRLHHFPGELSGGEQQRVALARAFVVKPSLLLADEPTGNLDPDTSDHVFDTLMELVRSTGMSALIATHNLDLAHRMDRVLRLDKGMLVAG